MGSSLNKKTKHTNSDYRHESPLTRAVQLPLAECVKREDKECELVVKVVVVGCANAGKSALLQRFGGHGFTEAYSHTYGIDVCLRSVEVDNVRVKFQVWDVSHRMTRHEYYRGASGIMAVFDISCEDSVKKMQDVFNEIEEDTPENTPVMLIGSKCDLEDERKLDYIDGKDLADKKGFTYMEVSARDGTNVELTFLTMATLIQEF